MIVKSIKQIHAGPEMSEILAQLTGRAEIVDAQGTVIGYLEPIDPDEDELYRKAALLFDPEEIRQSKMADGPWHTTEQVLERLRKLEQS